jgi:hypothetical protein
VNDPLSHELTQATSTPTSLRPGPAGRNELLDTFEEYRTDGAGSPAPTQLTCVAEDSLPIFTLAMPVSGQIAECWMTDRRPGRCPSS